MTLLPTTPERNSTLPMRRKRAKAHNILGDVQEFVTYLRESEQAPPAPPKEESFDIQSIPSEVIQAMKLSETTYQPILDAYKSLFRDRASLLSQHDHIQQLRASGADNPDLPANYSAVLAATRDKRTLEAHDALETNWATEAVDLGVRLGKQPSDLTLTRTFKYRQRREKLDHIFKSVPVSERVSGPAFWKMSLRNSFSQYVPVGNIFSGLFVEATEKPPEAVTVPLEIFGKPDDFDPSKSKFAQSLSIKRGLHTRRLLKTQEEKGRAWMQGSYLQTIEKKYAKYMNKLMPHYPDTSRLAIVGCSMEDILLGTAQRTIELQEVLERLKSQNEDAHAAFEAAQSAQAAADEARRMQEQELSDAAAAALLRTPGIVGPALTFSCRRLYLECQYGSSTTAVLRLNHPGSAAIYYQWSRRSAQLPFISHPKPSAQCFYMANQNGTILPSETKEFCFVFKPHQPGIFTETWYLHTQPALPKEYGPLEVVVRGCAVTEDVHKLQRRTLTAALAADQQKRQIEAAIDRALRNVSTPVYVHPHIPAADQAAHDNFAASMATYPGDPIFYSRECVSKLQSVFDEMLLVMCPPVDPKAKVKAPKKGEELPVPHMPDEWDGRVDTLLGYAEKMKTLEAEIPGCASTAEDFEASVHAALKLSILPTSQAVLNSYAMRDVLLNISDKIEASADKALQIAMDSESSKQEEAADTADLPKGGSLTTQAVKGQKDKVPEAVEPQKELFDKDEYDQIFMDAALEVVNEGFDALEPRVEQLRAHVGDILDERILAVQTNLVNGNHPPGSEPQLAWDTFALLRQREFHAVPTEPAPLLSKLTGTRQPL